MRDLKDFIGRLIEGADDVYFRDVIEAATGNRIIKVDSKFRITLLPLKSHFQTNLMRISKVVKGSYNGRANELSNYMESVVINEINKIKQFTATKPRVNGKGMQSAGYPDIFAQVNKQDFYLEVKTFQAKTKDSSLRSFYYKPSENSKVTKSCPHLLIAFEVESLGKDNKSPFVINDVKILDLYNLKVSLKPEFNANNIAVYRCSKI